MGDIYFLCPSCNESLALEEQYTGQSIECPACNEALTVPEAGVHFTCPSCETPMAAPPEMAGQSVSCLECNTSAPVPPSAPAPGKLTLQNAVDYDGKMNCPKCDALIEEDSVICIFCGFNLQSGEAVLTKMKKKKMTPKQMMTLAWSILSVLILVGAAVLCFKLAARGSKMPPPTAPKPAAKSTPAPKPKPEPKPKPKMVEVQPVAVESNTVDLAALAASEAEAARKAEEQVQRTEYAASLFGTVDYTPPVIVSGTLKRMGTGLEYKGERITQIMEMHEAQDWLGIINLLLGGDALEEYPEEKRIDRAYDRLNKLEFDLFVRTGYRNYDPKTRKFFTNEKTPPLMLYAFNVTDHKTPSSYTAGYTRKKQQRQWKIHPQNKGLYRKWTLSKGDAFVIFQGTPIFLKHYKPLKDAFSKKAMEIHLQSMRMKIDKEQRDELIEKEVKIFFKQTASLVSRL